MTNVLGGLLIFAAFASVVFVVGSAYAWLTSAPVGTATGAVANLRRTLHARDEARRMFCRSCRQNLATEDGYCSASCAEHDGEAQAAA